MHQLTVMRINLFEGISNKYGIIVPIYLWLRDECPVLEESDDGN